MFKFIKDIIAPKKCYSCKQEWHFLCEKCFFDLEKHYYFDQMCYVCKKYSKNFEVHKECKNHLTPLSGGINPLTPLSGGKKGNVQDLVFFDKTIILTHYKIKLIKKLVLDLKFYYKREIADDFAEFMVDKFIKYSKEELKKYKKEDFIVLYSPTSFYRKLVRWYNISELLAKKISKILWFEFWKNILLKSRHTRQQSKLSRQTRLDNLNNSFKIAKNKVDKVDKKIVILVDDVISTWTTLNEISKVLKQHNARKIICLTVASWY